MIKRAFFYTTRKRGKTLILLLTLFVISTFVLTGLSIRIKPAAVRGREHQTGTGWQQQPELDIPARHWWRVSRLHGYADHGCRY